jgi:glycosyltransferase involved in cell wall biosynthesis
VPPEDPGALATALSTLLRDPPLRERLIRRGRALVEESFLLPRIVSLYEDLFAGLLEGACAASLAR